MKKTLVFILAALMALSCLAGCRNKPGGASTSQEKVPEVSGSSAAGYVNPFTDAPPEGDVFVMNLAFGQDLWPHSSCYPFLSLRVLSKRPLDTTDCTVTMPIRTAYETNVIELSVIPAPATDRTMEASGYYTGAFPYYLYQAYQGMDWKELARLAAAQEENPLSEDGKAYDALLLKNWSDFLSLTAKDLPLFYIYEVQISFLQTLTDGKEIFDEECSRIELHLGDFDAVLEGGSFRLHADGLQIMTVGIHPHFLGNPLGELSCPYNDGIFSLNQIMDMDVLENITLTDFSLPESRIELLQLNVTVSSENGTSMDFCWDGQSPLELKAGDYVSFAAVVRDPAAANRRVETENGAVVTACYVYSGRFMALLRFDCGEEKGSWVTEYNLIRYPDPWEAYAVWFGGVDVASYYLDYVRPYDNLWHREIEGAVP